MSDAFERQLPAHWAVAPFEVAFLNVTSSSRKLPTSKYLVTGMYPVIDQGERLVGGYTNDKTLLHPGPVPAIVFGDHTRCVKYCPTPFVQGADGVKVLAPAASLHAKYAYWALKQAEVPSKGYARHFAALRRVRLPVAPTGEQHRIVSAIESHFTRLDDAVATLDRVQRNLKRYRASVLKAAVEGRLVPTEAKLARAEGRSYEPASVFIDRTEAPPRPNRWNSRSKDVVPGHAALAVGNPRTPLPEGWEWSPLVNIARMESGHTPSRGHPEWWDGDIPWIGIADARAHHGGTIWETVQHTNADGLANSAARLLPAGTVCVSRTASVGYVVVTGRPMATSQDFVNWIPTEAVTEAWLRLVFCASREALIQFGKGSVHKTIYFPEWLSVHVAVPPALEQARIVAEADRCLSVADSAGATLATGTARCTRLRQSILKWAFEGRLVDQDPSDEPASVLLERIRAERASATDKPPRRARSARAATKQGS